MKAFLNYLNNNKIIVCILLLATFLRFYNFSQRWALAYDQAWFAIISRHAIDTTQIPLLGPFASGGPFQTGGEWFWIVMFGIFLNPFIVFSPWIFIAFLSVLQVYLLFILGKEFVNRNFGYVLALIGTVSTSQTLQATNLTSQMTTSILGILLLYSFIKYIKTKKYLFLFIQGLAVGVASSIHLSGVLFILPLFISIIITKSFHPKKIILIIIGLVILWTPVLLVDIQNGLYNTRNMILYFVNPQSNVSYDELGRRWLTYIGVFWPSAWSRIFGGFAIFGYLQLVILPVLLILEIIKKGLKREWMLVVISTVVYIVVLRYIKTPLFENYLTFTHPFIFLLVGFIFWKLNKIFKKAAVLLFILFFIGSIAATVKDVSISTNLTAKSTENYIQVLKTKFPGEKFDVYDHKYKNGHYSLPLVYYLQTEKLLDDNGKKIGVFYATPGAQMKFAEHKAIVGALGTIQILDLSSSSSSELKESDWAPINPSHIYNSVQNWYKK